MGLLDMFGGMMPGLEDAGNDLKKFLQQKAEIDIRQTDVLYQICEKLDMIHSQNEIIIRLYAKALDGTNQTSEG